MTWLEYVETVKTLNALAIPLVLLYGFYTMEPTTKGGDHA